MDNQQERQTKLDLLQIPEMDKYFVDTKGNIFSTVRTSEPKKLSPYIHYGKSKNPYMRIKVNGKLYLQHRFIASIHIGRQLSNNEVVNHIDGNTLNNELCNLEVVSQHENVQHAVQNKLYCSGSAWHKARDKTKSL
jgi:hypothetical protein